MTPLRLSTGLLVGLLAGCWLLVATSAGHAQELRTPACLTETYNRMGFEERLFRSVIVGQRTADQLPVGAVRYDTRGRSWLKTASNTWRSIDTGATTTVMTDSRMDGQAEFPARRGILEARKVQTSDLLPSILQAFRAFQCRTRVVCMAAQDSLRRDAPALLKLQPVGCREFDNVPRLDSCRIEQNGVTANIGDTTLEHCEQNVRIPLVGHEARALALLVSYRSAYESLLQFAGIFEDFTSAFRQSIPSPFLQAIRILRTFSDIPCFTAQCDE